MSNSDRFSTMVVTPLGQRLSAVWLSYWTRPLMWIATLVYLVAVTAVLFVLHDPRPPFEQWEALVTDQQQRIEFSSQRSQWDIQRRLHVTPHFPTPSPRMRFGPPGLPPSKHRGKEVQPADARTIEIYSESDIPADFWEPGRYPKVEMVACYGQQTTPETLTKLLRTYRLKALTVNLSKDWTAKEFETLAQADSLEYLSIDFSRVLIDPAPLSWPKNLRYLQAFLYNAVPLARFQEWRQLPRLDVLSLRVAPEAMDKFLAPEIVAELDQFPRRPTLYLDTPQGTNGEPAVAAQPHFQRLAVRPAAVPMARLTLVFYGFVLLLIPTALALYHLSIQSMLPLMLLAPGAAAPHQNFAGRLFLLGGTVSAGLAMAYGSHWTAALAIGVSGLLWYRAQSSLLQGGKGLDAVGFAHPIIAAFPLMFLGVFFVVGMLLTSSYPAMIGEIDWFLRGQRPWLALGITGLGIFAGRSLLKKVVLTQRGAHEAGYSQVPMSVLDLAGWGNALAQHAGTKLENQLRWNPMMQRRERRIENALSNGPALTRWQRISIWMCGLHAHPADMTTVVVVIGLFFFAVYPVFRLLGEEVPIDRVSLLIPAMQTIVMFLMFPTGALWARRKWMAHELLFPLSRHEWKRDWYAMQACLLLPVPVLVGLLMLADTVLGGILQPTRVQIAMASAALLAAMVTAWAVGLIIATVRISWLTVVFGFVAAMLAMAAAMATAASIAGGVIPDATKQLDAVIESPTTHLIAAGLLTLVIAALVLWARRRWDNWEVGRVT